MGLQLLNPLIYFILPYHIQLAVYYNLTTMHLFRNKTTDVKNFIQQIKANKTNRSTNSTIDKKPKPPPTTSPEPFHSQYRRSNLSQSKLDTIDQRLKPNSTHQNNYNLNQSESNSFRGSVVSNPRSQHSVHSASHNFIPSPPYQQPISNYSPRPQEEIPFYKDPNPRPTYNNQPHFQPQYKPSQRFTNIQPDSQPIYDNQFTQSIHGNRNKNPFEASRSNVEYQKPNYTPFNPYQSQVQQGYYHNQIPRNFHQKSPEDRMTVNFQSRMSQNSNNSAYQRSQPSQSHQNISSHSNQPQEKEMSQNIRYTADNKYPNLQTKNNVRSNIQFDTRSSVNQNMKSNSFFKKNELSRLYTSQLNNPPMHEISEIDDCFSTQNDSPAKLTEFLSKSKFSIHEVEENPQNKVNQHQKVQIEEKKQEAKIQGQKQVKAEKTPEFRKEKKRSPKKREGVINKKGKQKKQQGGVAKKDPVDDKRKIESKVFAYNNNRGEQQETRKDKPSSIVVSETQKSVLQKSWYQMDGVHIKLDGILKQCSIILNNITRSDREFRSMLFGSMLMRRRNEREREGGEGAEGGEEKRERGEMEERTMKKGGCDGWRGIEGLMDERRTEKKGMRRYDDEIVI